jgi:hypothetical protein
MISLKWFLRMCADLVAHAFVNRAFAMTLAVFGLMALGLLILAVKITAPFIYTLF